MTQKSIPSAQNLWARHEALVLEVFENALILLCANSNLPSDEDNINDILYDNVRKSNFALNKIGRGLDHPPCYDGKKFTRSGEDVGQGKTRKRPDFTCSYCDSMAESAEDSFLEFNIECKRLGEKTSQTWILNKKYISNGIIRFLETNSNYGDGVKSGAMIGYVQSMKTADILAEVNKYIEKNKKHAIPALTFPSASTQKNKIMKTKQVLHRFEIFPSNFTLWHLWVDLRKSLLRSPAH